MVRLLASALMCLSVLACAREPSSKPVQNTGVAAGSAKEGPAPLPLPESAFTSDSDERTPRGPAAKGEARSRFETRRIGGDEGGGRPRYHGALVDLDVKNADLANVFRLLSDVGHVNIVITGELTGTITLSLKRVPWDQALDVIAGAKDLDVEHEGNVILVKKR